MPPALPCSPPATTAPSSISPRRSASRPATSRSLINGQRSNPSTDVLQGLAKYFRCSVTDVLALAEGRGGVVFS